MTIQSLLNISDDEWDNIGELINYDVNNITLDKWNEIGSRVNYFEHGHNEWVKIYNAWPKND